MQVIFCKVRKYQEVLGNKTEKVRKLIMGMFTEKVTSVGN